MCISVIDHCSAMMDSPNARQQCMKRELEGLLSSDERLQRVRAEMVLSPDLYLLCSFSFARAVDAVGGDGDTARVQTLNTLLQRASEAMSATGDDAVLNEYREAARWSEPVNTTPVQPVQLPIYIYIAHRETEGEGGGGGGERARARARGGGEQEQAGGRPSMC